jgi:hypothetical protein
MGVSTFILRPRIAALGVCAVALAAQALAQYHLDQDQPPEVLEPPSIPTLPVALAQGFLRRRAAADVQWVRVASYAGDHRFAGAGHPGLSELVGLVVALDPDFREAYLWGALALSDTPQSALSANGLFAQAEARFPDDWIFPFLMGANSYFVLGDAHAAASAWRRAAPKGGAPDFLLSLAARAEASGGDCEAVLAMAAQLAQSSSSAFARSFEERARHLSWECAFQRVEAAVRMYRSKYGKPPASVAELVASGVLTDAPRDPWGGQFGIGRTGAVVSTTSLPRIKLLQQRQAAGADAEGGGEP